MSGFFRSPTSVPRRVCTLAGAAVCVAAVSLDDDLVEALIGSIRGHIISFRAFIIGATIYRARYISPAPDDGSSAPAAMIESIFVVPFARFRAHTRNSSLSVRIHTSVRQMPAAYRRLEDCTEVFVARDLRVNNAYGFSYYARLRWSRMIDTIAYARLLHTRRWNMLRGMRARFFLKEYI